MIEIIERGPEKFVTTCRHCGTKFSYQLEDMRDNGYSPHVNCPVCKENCYHSISNIDNTNNSENNVTNYVSDSLRNEFPSFYR